MTVVKIRRTTGDLVAVTVPDGTCYMVGVGPDTAMDAEWYMRWVIIRADSARDAKNGTAPFLEVGEVVSDAQRLSLGEVAVLILHGHEVVGER